MKSESRFRCFFSAVFLFVACVVSGQVTFDLDLGVRGVDIGARHYGIFFEEINHAGDGGLYAELIHNRSFEDNDGNPDKWWTVGGAEMTLVSEDLLNEAQEWALQVVMTTDGDGVRNEGFWGINVVNGQRYKLSFWVKGVPSYKGVLTAQLQTEAGVVLGSTDIDVDLSDEWVKLTAEIVATGDDTAGWFSLTGSTGGTIELDVVSLFPPTFKDRENGCREDLAQLLADMSPAFMRFPGGCLVEGYYSDGNTNRFEWKKTIGPIEERPGHWNINWGYRMSDGFGFHEMLQLAEDLGAEPLFVVNIGIGHNWYEEYTEIDEFIEEALDAIEYCNGDTTTTWGRIRAANGHPEPFNLRLLEIGNENYNYYSDSNSDQSDHYAERYEQFRAAIRAKYPEVTLIGNVESWSTDTPSWRNGYQVDVVDEHYYRYPSWFVNMYNKYDSYNRSNYKIYVGEYAVTSDYGTYGNLNAALGEAVYMLGMENNADVCVMGSYAPIFVNENNYNWRPDMIRFNSYMSYGTPSYHVQQLFPNNVGKQNVTWTESGNVKSADNLRVGLSTWSTAAYFDNLKVTDGDGNVIASDDFTDGSLSLWTGGSAGTWSVSDGALYQMNRSMQGSILVYDTAVGENYTIELEATKMSGSEGFLIAFNYVDDDNFVWWNLGGWSNSAHGIEVCSDGSKSTVASVSGYLETYHTYAIKIVVAGTKVKCYLDGELVHSVSLPSSRNVYASANIDDDEGVLYLKFVNPSETAQTVTVNVANGSVSGGSVTVMSGATGYEENTTDDPYNVLPVESDLSVSGTRFEYEVSAYSLNILRLNVSDVTIVESEAAELPEPIVKYSFEGATLADDSGLYAAETVGDAAVVTMDDGNKALFTGKGSETAYLDLGTAMPEVVFAGVDGDYSVSVDIAVPTGALQSEYTWAYSIVAGTYNYIGLYEGPENTYWYVTTNTASGYNDLTLSGGLGYDVWHNVTFVCSDGTGLMYVDGRVVKELDVELLLSDLSTDVDGAYIGRSPHNTSELMTGTYFDNFAVYDCALSAEQVSLLYDQTCGLSVGSSEVTLDEDADQISVMMKVFGYLHASVDLPSQTDNGTSVVWEFEPADGSSDYVVLSSGELTVNKLPEDGVLEVGVIKAVLGDTGYLEISTTVRLAPDDDRYGYLYCYMNSGSEITNFALGSKEDKGKVFNELIGGDEIFDTEELAAIEHGTRDAFIGRGEGEYQYFITTTDMSNATSGVWYNYGIDLIRSCDLIHWESTTFDFREGKSIFSDATAATGVYDSNEEYALINRVWAPQFIYDSSAECYLVYYSMLSDNEGDDYDKIYYSYSDVDFCTLTQPRVLFDPGFAVIDADIVYNPYDGLYHLFYKREGASESERGIYEATSSKLVGGSWTDVLHVTNEGTALVEGSSAIRRINEDVYNLYYMRYSDGSAYKYCELDHLGLNPSYASALDGTGDFQHGSFMTLTEEEYTMLQAWSDVKNYIPTVEELEAESGSAVFSAALEKADEALALTSVSELAVALPEAYEVLTGSYWDYIEDLALNTDEGEWLDLTFLLVNPDFADGSDGWSGTSFTQALSGVAEFYNKGYNTYQILNPMPAGRYVLQCQGFYRYGSIDNAYAAHENGTEELLAKLYLNDSTASFMSLFDESAPYTYSPYTYPDGVWGADEAFNVDGSYSGNEVYCTLEEKGALKVGLSKASTITYDWNCFDNFKLYYIGGGSATAIREVSSPAVSESSVVDVYGISGVLLRSGVAVGEALKGLPRGIYIVGGRKFVVE